MKKINDGYLAVWILWKLGWSYNRIAKVLKMSKGNVWYILQKLKKFSPDILLNLIVGKADAMKKAVRFGNMDNIGPEMVNSQYREEYFGSER